MKKFLSLLLAVMMLLGCIPAMADESAFEYNADKLALIKYTGEAADLVVPSVHGGAPAPILYQDTISRAKTAATLTFSEGITQIRRGNIANLNVTQVTLPASLEVLGRRNFYQTDSLVEAVIPAAVAYVGSECFSYCDALTKVTFTGICPAFGPDCFRNAAAGLVVYVPDDQLAAYQAALPEGVNIQPSGKNAVDARVRVSESDFAFDAATGTITGYSGTVACVEIPASIGGVQVKAIGEKAFYRNPYLSMLVVPEGVESIGVSAVSGMNGLYRVALPSTLCTIAKNAFYGTELDGIVLPEGLEVIEEGAFNNAMPNAKVAEVVIPDSVTTIGKSAFNSCKIVKVVIGANVQELPEKAFGTCFDLETVVIRNTRGMTISENAFKSAKAGAAITLMDGIMEDVYNSYTQQLAAAYPGAVVNQPVLGIAFPALDAEAGAPFVGIWHGVAVNDGTDFYGMDLLGMSVDVVLNADGTGTLTMDGEGNPGGWYVENGAAMFAPIMEEGGAPVQEEAAALTQDENGRMLIDLGGIILLLEQEGKTYAVPAIPEKPWPAFDLDNAKNFIGSWEAVTYVMDGETYTAEQVGPMVLTLNSDGTAVMSGDDIALKWYAEYGTAYVGPAMSDLAQVTFDGTGNIRMDQEGFTVILAPYAEAAVIEGADELLGEWLDDIGNKLVLGNDGSMSYTYASDGWTYEEKWNVVGGAAVVTEGRWAGCPITLENGILTITNGEGIFQIFSVDGDLSAYYGNDDSELPAAAPIGPEGEPYFGTWTMDMGGMAMNLTLNQDGTCTMEMMGEADPGVWTVENGKAMVMGDALIIDSNGNLVMESQGMVFVRSEGDAASMDPSDEELLALLAMLAQMEGSEGAAGLPEHLQPYVGTWHMVYIATGGLEGDLRAMGITAKLELNADGTGKLSGAADDAGKWYDDEGQVRFGQADAPLTLLDGGFLRYGSQLAGYMVFSQDEAAVWNPAPVVTAAPAAPAAPAVPAAPVSSGDVQHVGTKFVCKTYTTFGQTLDAAMLGAEYSIRFNADNTCELMMAGAAIPPLPYTVNAEGVYAINYYGTMFNCVPTAVGFDMDYYGTMTMHFVPAE